MIGYSEDSLEPDFQVGFQVSAGGGAPPSATVTGQVASPGACTTCGNARLVSGLSFPIVLIAVAVLVLALRR
jgi:hypothetical protein